MRKQNGYTLIELVMVIWFIVVAAIMGGVAYAVIHFVSKFW